METFSALLAIWAGNSPVTGEFPAQRPVTWSFDVFFDLRLNKPLSKQSWGWWFDTPTRSLWRHCNETVCEHLCDQYIDRYVQCLCCPNHYTYIDLCLSTVIMVPIEILLCIFWLSNCGADLHRWKAREFYPHKNNILRVKCWSKVNVIYRAVSL